MILRLGDHLSRLMLRFMGFESRFVDTYHGRVHYFEAEGRGGGPPMVLVHGIGASAGHWAPLLPRLRQLSRRVIAIDLLGHGFSADPPDLHPHGIFGALGETIEGLGAEPVVLVGNSLGGGLSLAFAMVRPERVGRLLLLSPGGAWMEPEELRAMVGQFRMETPEVARDFVRRLYARTPFYAGFLAWAVRSVFHRPSMRHLVDHLSPDILHTAETMAALRVPARVLWGRDDRVLPPDNLDFFKTHLPGAISEPEGVGHCPQVENPRLTLRWIEANLA